jgi:phosphatidylserine decarboxylase
MILIFALFQHERNLSSVIFLVVCQRFNTKRRTHPTDFFLRIMRECRATTRQTSKNLLLPSSSIAVIVGMLEYKTVNEREQTNKQTNKQIEK